MDKTRMDDRADMERLVTGHDAALNDLMERHSERLFHYLLRVLQNEEDAADIAQETFVRVYRNREKFNASQKFTTWLYAIATNLARDQMRWRTRHPAVSLEGLTPEGETTVQVGGADDVTPSDRLQSTELSEAVRRAVTALPEELRVPLVLAEYQEMPQAEIAEILNCSLKAVETRIYRARKHLRDRLQHMFR